MMLKLRRRRIAAVLCAVLAVAGCGDDPLPTTPTLEAPNEAFASVLAVGGFSWRSFTIEAAGDVTVQFASLDPDSSTPVGLGLGDFDGTNCTIFKTVEATASLVDKQITHTATIGRYCVRIWDLGNLTRSNRFFIVIDVP